MSHEKVFLARVRGTIQGVSCYERGRRRVIVDVEVNVLNCKGLKHNIRYTVGRGPSARLITMFAEHSPRAMGVLARATGICSMGSTRGLGSRVSILVVYKKDTASLPIRAPRCMGCFGIISDFSARGGVPRRFTGISGTTTRDKRMKVVSMN